MELLLLIVLVVGLATNILVMRYFFKRISDKISFLTADTTIDVPSTPYKPDSPLKQFPWQNNGTTGTYRSPVDLPTPNQIDNDEETLELNEQNLTSLPKDVRLEVEGGDMHTPPGFTEGKN